MCLVDVDIPGVVSTHLWTVDEPEATLSIEGLQCPTISATPWAARPVARWSIAWWSSRWSSWWSIARPIAGRGAIAEGWWAIPWRWRAIPWWRWPIPRWRWAVARCPVWRRPVGAIARRRPVARPIGRGRGAVARRRRPVVVHRIVLHASSRGRLLPSPLPRAAAPPLAAAPPGLPHGAEGGLRATHEDAISFGVQDLHWHVGLWRPVPQAHQELIPNGEEAL